MQEMMEIQVRRREMERKIGERVGAFSKLRT